MELYKEYSTAAHEAGHAIMSLLLGRGVDYVTIEQSKEDPAHCSHGGSVNNTGSEEDILERECMILYAGMVAEKVMLNLDYIEDLPKLFLYSYTDRMQATAAVQVYYGINDETEDEDWSRKIVYEYLLSIQSKTDDMLSSPLGKRQLTAVTNALMMHRRLTGEQVKELMKAE